MMRRLRLTRSQDTMTSEQDYVDLGLSRGNVCKAHKRGLDGKTLGDLRKSVSDTINQRSTKVDFLYLRWAVL